MVRVAIASNSAVVREGLKSILAHASGLEVHMRGDDRAPGPHLHLDGAIDLLIADLALAGPGNEFEFIRQLKSEHPAVPVLAMGARFEQHAAIYALRAGAAGYLSQHCLAGELIAAVQRVAGGGKYIPPALAEILAHRLDLTLHRPPHESLSRREWQVFLGLASGRSPSQIAAGMALSVKTISTYRSRILEKMGLSTTSELMHYAIQNRITESLPRDFQPGDYPAFTSSRAGLAAAPQLR